MAVLGPGLALYPDTGIWDREKDPIRGWPGLSRRERDAAVKGRGRGGGCIGGSGRRGSFPPQKLLLLRRDDPLVLISLSVPSLRGELKIPFPSSTLAKIALGSLAPDPEPRKGGIIKELDVTDNILHVQWRAEEARILRVSINSFLEHLSLVVETMDLFGPPVA